METAIQTGKAHSLHFRQRVALDIHDRKNSRQTVQSIANRYAIDKKTACKYYHLWLQDKENQLDYTNPEHLARSVLKPLARVRKVPSQVPGHPRFRYELIDRRPERVRRFGEETWKSISDLLAKIQTEHVPTFTAEDICHFVNKQGANDPVVSKFAGLPEKSHAIFQDMWNLLPTRNGAKELLRTSDVKYARMEHNLSYKTVAYDYIEKDVQYVKEKTRDLKTLQGTLFAENCVFLDEFSMQMNAAPRRAWAKEGEQPRLRRREQTDTKTIVWAAMKWPKDDNKPSFFIRIFPPVPARIGNHMPATNKPEEELCETLRDQGWWEGVMTVVGDMCRQIVGEQSGVRLFVMQPTLQLASKPGGGLYEWFVSGRRPREKKPCPSLPKTFGDVTPSGHPAVNGREVYKYTPNESDIWCERMRALYWDQLPDETPIASFVDIFKSDQEKVLFILRLAAYDFAIRQHVNEHNYKVDNRTYGEPSPNTWLGRGNDRAFDVSDVLQPTKDLARSHRLMAYDDTVGRFDYEEDFEDSIQLMLEFLYDKLKNSDLLQIYQVLFEPQLSQESFAISNEIEKQLVNPLQPLYSREYHDAVKSRTRADADRRENLKQRDMALPRAIYAALNFSTQKTSQKSELTATEIAVQVWKMVHYCKGDKDKLYENLNTVLPSVQETGEEYAYGERGQKDKYYNGDSFPDKLQKAIKDKARAQYNIGTIRQTHVSPITRKVSQMRERNVGAAPMAVSKQLFRLFMQTLPDSFVVGKTILMDNASIHSPPSNKDIALNKDLPPELRVFPQSELSPIAGLLRRRGGGDGVLLPPTEMTKDERRPALIFTPPYSPELNPIEQAFNTIKHFIRKESYQHTRTRFNLSVAIINSVHVFVRPHAIKNYMLCAGYRSVEKNVKPRVAPAVTADEDGTEQIQQLKGRDTCVARFVDGKYEDPDKKKRPSNPARPAQLMAPAQAFGGFAPRPHCPGTLGADDSLTTYENGRCRRPRTDEYWVGQSVRVLAKSGEWKEASILALPDSNKKVRVKNREGVPTNPWFRVRFEEPVCEDKGAANEGGRVCSVMVNRIRPSEERQAQTIAARKAVEDENAKFKEEQRRRREAEFKNQEQRIVELRKSLYLSPEGAPMAGERRRHEQKAKEIMKSLLDKLREERAPPPAPPRSAPDGSRRSERVQQQPRPPPPPPVERPLALPSVYVEVDA